MNISSINIVILGLSITSSWGNGHATTYRGLVRELSKRGHRVLFLERDKPWYADNRDLPHPPYGRTDLYDNFEELTEQFTPDVREADLVIVGSFVPEGAQVGKWVNQTAGGLTAFYDIDTPVTLAKMRNQDFEYLHPDLIPQFDIYLSFTGGPVLKHLEQYYGSPMARPLYCGVDPETYCPQDYPPEYDLGYLGTYSADRQPALKKLLMDAAEQWPEGRFVVAGPQYPEFVIWPENVQRIYHLAPNRHPRFYNVQSFTLNLTRADMIQAGYSPSVRLFEAAACGTPIISDYWQGLETFFTIGEEILISRSADETLKYLQNLPEEKMRQIGDKARKRILIEHTATHRAIELEKYINAQWPNRRIKVSKQKRAAYSLKKETD